MQRPRKGPEIEDDFFETETAQSPYPPIVITDLPTDIVLPRLVCVRGTPPSWTARCPAHADHDPSLSLAETEDKRLLIHCHAGCTAEQVMAAIGLDLQQLFPAPYAIRHGRRHKNPLSQPLSELPDIRAGENLAIDYPKFDQLFQAFRCPTRRVRDLARHLGLPRDSLLALDVGFSPEKDCWTFPERDDEGRIVGITYRFANGRKTCEPGSKRGLSIPSAFHGASDSPIFIAEGASDTAALHSVGETVIGRPAAHATSHVLTWLSGYLRKVKRRRIIVLGDRDKSSSGRRAGRDGAIALKIHLSRLFDERVDCALPARPFKDMRDQVLADAWGQNLVIIKE